MNKKTKYAIIGSGSKANSFIFETAMETIVIDNGYSYQEFSKRLSCLKYDIANIKYIVVTHIHSDHIKGIKPLAKRHNLQVVLHEEIEKSPKFSGISKKFGINPGKKYKLGNTILLPFSTYHDAPNSLSYRLVCNDISFTLITDTGKIDDTMVLHAMQSDIVFLEANYNSSMLMNGPYANNLKKRIHSDTGHLSNIAAINFANKLDSCNSKIKIIYFCHISDNNNSEDQLLEDIEKYGTFSFKYILCKRDKMIQGVDPCLYHQSKQSAELF